VLAAAPEVPEHIADFTLIIQLSLDSRILRTCRWWQFNGKSKSKVPDRLHFANCGSWLAWGQL